MEQNVRMYFRNLVFDTRMQVFADREKWLDELKRFTGDLGIEAESLPDPVFEDTREGYYRINWRDVAVDVSALERRRDCTILATRLEEPGVTNPGVSIKPGASGPGEGLAAATAHDLAVRPEASTDTELDEGLLTAPTLDLTERSKTSADVDSSGAVIAEPIPLSPPASEPELELHEDPLDGEFETRDASPEDPVNADFDPERGVDSHPDTEESDQTPGDRDANLKKRISQLYTG